jgi:hypothetical protein
MFRSMKDDEQARSGRRIARRSFLRPTNRQVRPGDAAALPRLLYEVGLISDEPCAGSGIRCSILSRHDPSSVSGSSAMPYCHRNGGHLLSHSWPRSSSSGRDAKLLSIYGRTFKVLHRQAGRADQGKQLDTTIMATLNLMLCHGLSFGDISIMAAHPAALKNLVDACGGISNLNAQPATLNSVVRPSRHPAHR